MGNGCEKKTKSYIQHMSENVPKSLKSGEDVIRGYLKNLPDSPGVYRMVSEKSEVLYVGKAKALKKRVSNYTQVSKLPQRLQRMVASTSTMEFVHTHTEAEALLLEANLIKKLKPRFNILLRDDKSFPYICISADHDFPMIKKHRGAKKQKGDYYGPFASAGDVNRTISILQRVFLLRNCTDYNFSTRSRPCLQYHIKRCTAPCVDMVSKRDYEGQVREAKDFLEGKSREVRERLKSKMKTASETQDYEQAARFRDRIRALASIQARQDINIEGLKNADVMALTEKQGQACIQVFFFRAGRNNGNRAYFPRHSKEETSDAILLAFITQFYQNKQPPKEIYVSEALPHTELLQEALSSQADHNVKVLHPIRGARKRVVDFVMKNAVAALERHMIERAGEAKLLEGVAELFDLDELPGRIEVYDNSHISGTDMVGAMIVAGAEGLQKNAYRKFNIKTAGGGDDYAMMREVLQRRFKQALKDPDVIGGPDWPDVLLIDGGLGQFNAAKAVLEDIGILDSITMVAIAKGQDRNAGRETFHVLGRPPFQLPQRDPVLHYLQRLRDEAHRFAIGSHRARRQKKISASPLNDIAGIGAKRKKALLHHYGSAKEISRAGVSDLAKVEGISKAIAQKIYDHFHEA